MPTLTYHHWFHFGRQTKRRTSDQYLPELSTLPLPLQLWILPLPYDVHPNPHTLAMATAPAPLFLCSSCTKHRVTRFSEFLNSSTYSRICTHMHAHNLTHVYAHTCMHTTLLTYMHTHACTQPYSRICTHMHAHNLTHVCAHTCMHTTLLTYVHTHACTHIHKLCTFQCLLTTCFLVLFHTGSPLTCKHTNSEWPKRVQLPSLRCHLLSPAVIGLLFIKTA